ncbi:MAG: PAS domain S-box protein [bacterium]|nr:PAS domain S-box protein [bacterium]
MIEDKNKSKEVLIQELESLRKRVAKLLITGGKEYHRVEEELRKSEQKYSTVFQHSPDLIYINDIHGFFVDANPATLELQGLTMEELKKKNALDFFVGDNLNELVRMVDVLKKTEPIFGLKIQVRTGRGKIIMLEINAVPLYENGEVVSVLSLARDITERVNAEEKLKQAYEEMEARVTQRTLDMVKTNHELRAEIAERKRAEEAIRISEEKYKLTVENIPVFIGAINQTGKYELWNKAAEKMLGYTAKEVIGKLTPFDLYENKKDVEEVVQIASKTGIYDKEVMIKRKDKTFLTMHLIVVPNRDSTGKIVGFYGFGEDITERKRLEKEILEIGVREQRRIGNNLHDGLGQQLTAISFMNKVLEDKLAATSPAEAREAARISKLISDAITQTRDLARGINPVDFQADGLMASLRQLSVNLGKFFKISCVFKCARRVLVNDSMVSTNLYYIAQEATSNAIRHGKAKHVEVGLAQVKNKLTLSVSDDGVGMPKNMKPNGGLGLQIMNYRAKIIGANLEIHPGRKGGTVVTCSVFTTAAGSKGQRAKR